MASQKADVLLRASDAARALGIAQQSLYTMGNRGNIAYIVDSVSGWRLYAPEEIERVRRARAAHQIAR